jgi:hypothetical protein
VQRGPGPSPSSRASRGSTSVLFSSRRNELGVVLVALLISGRHPRVTTGSRGPISLGIAGWSRARLRTGWGRQALAQKEQQSVARPPIIVPRDLNSAAFAPAVSGHPRRPPGLDRDRGHRRRGRSGACRLPRARSGSREPLPPSPRSHAVNGLRGESLPWGRAEQTCANGPESAPVPCLCDARGDEHRLLRRGRGQRIVCWQPPVRNKGIDDADSARFRRRRRSGRIDSATRAIHGLVSRVEDGCPKDNPLTRI